VDIVSAALAGAEGKNEKAAAEPAKRGWFGRTTAAAVDAHYGLQPPEVTIGDGPELGSPDGVVDGAANSVVADAKAKEPAKPGFLERWRQRRAAAQAAAKAPPPGAPAVDELAPPEVDVPGGDVSLTADTSKSPKAARGWFSGWAASTSRAPTTPPPFSTR
jgi:hypothetical protein